MVELSTHCQVLDYSKLCQTKTVLAQTFSSYLLFSSYYFGKKIKKTINLVNTFVLLSLNYHVVFHFVKILARMITMQIELIHTYWFAQLDILPQSPQQHIGFQDQAHLICSDQRTRFHKPRICGCSQNCAVPCKLRNYRNFTKISRFLQNHFLFHLQITKNAHVN